MNGEPIGADVLARELRERARARARGRRRGRAPPPRPRRARGSTLLLEEARARSIVVGQDQVERAFLRVRAEYPGTHFDDLLAQQRLSQASSRRASPSS